MRPDEGFIASAVDALFGSYLEYNDHLSEDGEPSTYPFQADFSAKNQRHPTQVFAKRQTASRRVVIATGNVTGEGVESEMRR
jgi:hypothetical protein